MIKRCSWVNLNNPIYVKYHDEEWGILKEDDNLLFEALALEILQCGLSFECVLNKREALNKAFDNFNLDMIINYDDNKLDILMENKDIIRHKGKLLAIINNSKIFKEITLEYNGFINYLFKWTSGMVLNNEKIKNEISRLVTNDLIRRGMKFIGLKTIRSYLEAIGVINGHSDCDWQEVK